MVRKIMMIGVFLGWVSGVSAQKPEDHQKTTYTDSLGRFIVQLDLPLYFYVSTSPDGDKQRLNRSDDKENKPVYLDGPGRHHIRHNDNINHRAEVFDIYADGQAPVTSISLKALSFVKEGVTYFGKDLSVDMKATDDLAGVKQTYYSTKQGNFSPYKTFDISVQEGFHQLQYYSVDYVGNVEDVKTREFCIDLSAPVTYHNIVGIAGGNVISTSSKLYLISTDSLSGINKIVYWFDDEKEKIYKSGSMISFTYLSDGEHTLNYYSVDNVQNKEELKSFTFFFDKTAPIMSADVLGDRFIVGDKVYFSGRTKLKLTAVDNKSGVKEIMYSVDGGDFVPYEDPFYLPSQAGKHTISYYALDEMGNSSKDNYTHNVGIVYVDLVGPQLSYQLSGPNFRKGDVLFLSPESKIVLKAVDAESGTQYMSYSIDDQKEEVRYTEPFSVKESGTHVVKYFGYDNVNNRNSDQLEITVDGEGPEIFHTFSIQRIDKEGGVSSDPEFVGEYPSYMMLYLAATDLLTGGADIFYSINGQPEVAYVSPIKNFQKGQSYTIVITAKDKLGNMSEKTIKFKTTDY
ncbi:MAG: hypothetical protein LBQ60_04800 [Bacteroidales bacterium]|nr:hypothetical protein [Bacteroidales bacterium]